MSAWHHDVMHVLVSAAAKRMQRTGERRWMCRLTWAQIMGDLERCRRAFGTTGPLSRRSLARWLRELERLKFIYRHTDTRRDKRGRILWRLTTFTFGPSGILWIKRFWPNYSIGRGRSIVPKMALRSERALYKERLWTKLSTGANFERQSDRVSAKQKMPLRPRSIDRGAWTTAKDAAELRPGG